ncbi:MULTISPECIES: 4-alpha-glucanotransferase [Hydrogenophilus]|uniref:4-alpha-glucanotransferase n=1 Tax=Hydrogenophilus thermoluteolus TaxID=297 RepID=A0A2Z6DXW9_HYDTE|nr:MULTISPECIES: 4-alpha-glucanotransferase [Hydrogenophilus]BBD77155.1 4-alpha-glucanotransferase [Hydrogenophilus thermoluteolus]
MVREWLERRAAGVLLHPTALAGDDGLTEARVRAFVAWMAQAGLRLWQILPIHPPRHVSPYECVTSFAVNERLFAAEWLQRTLPPQETVESALQGEVWLSGESGLASPGLAPFAPVIARERVKYALFCYYAHQFPDRPFWAWPPDLALFREDEQLPPEARGWLTAKMARLLAAERAWQQVLALVHEAGIWVVGDLPFFVAANSADVWGNRAYFLLQSDGSPAFVAGVPPDYFSASGQRWGNPQYDWGMLRETEFGWWRARLAAQLSWCDGVRLDHFRGYQAVWSIPEDAPTAETGCWVPVPGDALFARVRTDCGGEPLPFIAEDLGIITDEVRALQAAFHLPGISVLQFGFDGLPGNPHAPHAIPEWQWVMTGTHDNATTLEWWNGIEDGGYREWILAQLPHSDDPMPWPMIDAALASRARWAVIPIADWLGLGAEARFNVPGTVNERNWRWRVPEGALRVELAQRIRDRVERFARG